MADSTFKLTWDDQGKKLYETGVRRCVLYPVDDSGKYSKGYAWNGVTSISENPSGADETKLYANDTKYLGLRAKEDFGATIEAYTYPDAWAECDGTKDIATGVRAGQQTRKVFALCYRTAIGNDLKGDDYGYKIHIIYNATASPSSRQYSTMNESPEAMSLSWEISTTPIDFGTGFKEASTITIDSTKANATALAKLEAMLYGTVGVGKSGDEGYVAEVEASLPTPSEIATMFSTVTADTQSA